MHAIASGIFHIIPAPVLSNHALTITPSSINGGALTPDLSAAATAGGTPLLPTATFEDARHIAKRLLQVLEEPFALGTLQLEPKPVGVGNIPPCACA